MEQTLKVRTNLNDTATTSNIESSSTAKLFFNRDNTKHKYSYKHIGIKRAVVSKYSLVQKVSLLKYLVFTLTPIVDISIK